MCFPPNQSLLLTTSNMESEGTWPSQVFAIVCEG